MPSPGIYATFQCDQGITYTRYYRSRRGFLSAYSRMRKHSFLNAVDGFIVITPSNIHLYREGKM